MRRKMGRVHHPRNRRLKKIKRIRALHRQYSWDLPILCYNFYHFPSFYKKQIYNVNNKIDLTYPKRQVTLGVLWSRAKWPRWSLLNSYSVAVVNLWSSNLNGYRYQFPNPGLASLSCTVKIKHPRHSLAECNTVLCTFEHHTRFDFWVSNSSCRKQVYSTFSESSQIWKYSQWMSCSCVFLSFAHQQSRP